MLFFRPEQPISPRTIMDHGPALLHRSQLAILPGGEPRNPQDGAGTPGPESKPTLVWRSRLPIAIAFGVAFVALVLWLVTGQSGPSALRHLPAEERTALVQRTLANLHDICRSGDRPREFCKEQANLLLDLPECGEACQAEARNEVMADSAVK
jgi:hypothetical protein